MQALTKSSDAKQQAYFEINDVADIPAPTADQVQVAIHCVGICTSDVHVLHGHMHVPDGNIVGHEFSGSVHAIGENCVQDFTLGDKVICELAVDACFHCEYCDSGRYEFCSHKRPPGWASQGVYTEFINMPKHCVMAVDSQISYQVAAMAEPVAICVYGIIERAQVQPDHFTVIYGMGPIGLLSLIVLQDLGLRNIMCVTPTHNGSQRLELAKALGCEHVYAADEDITNIVAALSDGKMADVVIDCSGAINAINQGIDILKKDACLVGLGIASQEQLAIDFNKALLKALTIVFSCSSSHQAWLRTKDILRRQHDKINQLITHQYPLADWRQAYDAIESREAIKALLVPPHSALVH